MQTVGTKLAAAMAAGNPQRCLLIFTDDEGEVTGIFTNEDIVITEGIQITAMFNSEKELTIGLCPSVHIQYSLLNDVRQLSEFEFGTFRAYIGAMLDDDEPDDGVADLDEDDLPDSGPVAMRFDGGLYEFTAMGVYTVDRPDVVSTDIIKVSATDRMTLFEKEIPEEERSSLTVSTTLGGLAQIICNLVDVPLATTTFLNHDLAVKLSNDDINGRAYRDVLRWIVEAAGSIGVFNRDGQLEIRWFETTSGTYDENDYDSFAATWYETEVIDGLKIRNKNNTYETPVLPTGTEPGTEMTNPYVISYNPFLS